MIQKLDLQDVAALEQNAIVTAQSEMGMSLEARWIDRVEDLEDMELAWRDLAANSIRDNLQMHPNFLIPAFRHLGDGQVRVLVIESTQTDDDNGKVLCALLPLIKTRFYHLPLNCCEIWRDDQCLDATPLIRRDAASEIFTFVLETLNREGVGLLSCDTVSAEGSFGRLLSDVSHRLDLNVFQRDQFSRASFRPDVSVEQYMLNCVSKNLRKNIGRLQRRLKEQGEFQVKVSSPQSDFQHLAQQFLDLEASGWKGREATALASKPATEQFFREMVERSAEANVVSFLSLTSAGKTIAMLCDLYHESGGCAYKTAFDESFSQYSPGLLAEIKSIEHMHSVGIQRMDSCTDPNNATINRIWKDRIAFQNVVIALNSGLPNLATQLMPLLQGAAKRWRRFRKR